MENRGHDIVHKFVAAEFQERLARGVAAQQLAEAIGGPVRARLAAALCCVQRRSAHGGDT